jgi:hypothetical protein
MQPDAFKSYLNAIGNYPLLTADQEIQLSRQIQRMLELKEADRELSSTEQRQVKIGERAKEKLIKCNLKLVVALTVQPKSLTAHAVTNSALTLTGGFDKRLHALSTHMNASFVFRLIL